ncbi:Beta-galactosidase [Halotydeus destructor]|nr:Beta-galactosidase [Halotydeus destructor]
MKLAILVNLIVLVKVAVALNSFVIDYENNQFLRDGQPFRYVSGEMHYFRVRRELWRDRLTKMRLAGLNAVQTYIEWSTHEPEPGSFIQLEDITDFIKTAQEVGLLVILRPGPYICAERDFGGFPYWLLQIEPAVIVRSYDLTYLHYVNNYLGVVLTAVRPLLYANGGPVIMVQVENEYGNYGCDKMYTSSLRDMFRKFLGDDVVLFTTDNASQDVHCGKIEGVYATVDFGVSSDVDAAFAMQRQVEPSGPLVNSEFYTGWLDHWSEPHQTVGMDHIGKTLMKILDKNASVSMYMFHGGTNFDYKNGANGDDIAFRPQPTSYDYDAPLTEAGDPSSKYFAIRNLIGRYLPLPNGTLPKPAPKLKLDQVQLYPFASLSEILSYLSTKTTAEYPMTFEQLGVAGGYVIYRTTINFQSSDPSQLTISGLRDRAQVILDGKLVGILSRREGIYSMPVQASQMADLVVIVESQGRLNNGAYIPYDRKGITGNVTLGSTVLTSWTHHYDLILGPVSRDHFKSRDQPTSGPAAYFGTFSLPPASQGLDTYLRLDGWGKGVAFVNGVNIGRYWPDQGPQVTLYVPNTLLETATENYISLFETERAPCLQEATCAVSFCDTPVISGLTPAN